MSKKKQITLTLPIPLSINHMYYNTRGGGKRLTKKAEDYVKMATDRIKAQVERQGWKLENDNSWFYVDMVFYFGDKRIRDSHNTLKILFDILQGHIFVNDYFAMPRVLSVELDADNPRVEIIIHNQVISEREKYLQMFNKVV